MPKKVNPKSLENLKSFEKGNKLGGRKKGSVSLVSLLQKALDRKISLSDPMNGGQKTTQEVSEWIVTALLTKCVKGDVTAIKEVLERIDGKVLQKTETTVKTHEQALMELE